MIVVVTLFIFFGSLSMAFSLIAAGRHMLALGVIAVGVFVLVWVQNLHKEVRRARK